MFTNPIEKMTNCGMEYDTEQRTNDTDTDAMRRSMRSWVTNWDGINMEGHDGAAKHVAAKTLRLDCQHKTGLTGCRNLEQKTRSQDGVRWAKTTEPQLDKKRERSEQGCTRDSRV